MSTIKLNGTTSGSSIIKAPDSGSTNQTFTLPASTGTLATTADVPSSITDNGDATAITIDSSENVGIGTASTTAKLEVKKSGVVNAQISNATNGHYFVSQSDDSTDGFEIYQQHGTNTTRNSFIVNDNRTGSKSSAFRVRNDGLTIHGGGLTFNGDTAAANALDDYEEGEYTPTVTCSTSGSYNLGGSNTAMYTKIGRVVHIQGYINITSENSPNGSIKMSLPFAPTNLTDDGEYVMAHCSLTNTGHTTAGTKQLFILADGAYLHNITDGGVASYITHAEVDTVWQLGFGFSYIVQ